MSRARTPAGATSEETARAAARELHEAIQDARAAARELHEIQVEMDELLSTAIADTNKFTAGLAKHMDENRQIIEQTIADAARRITESHAGLLGMKTPEDVLTFIANAALKQLQEPVTQIVEDRLPMLIQVEMKKIADRGKTRRQIAMTADRLAAMGILVSGDGK